MFHFFLTPMSVVYFSQLFVVLVITVIIVQLLVRARIARDVRTHLTILVLFLLSLLSLLVTFFVYESAQSIQHNHFVYMGVLQALTLYFLTEFAYHFPHMRPQWQRELLRVRIVFALYLLFVTVDVIYRYRDQPVAPFIPEATLILVFCGWGIVVLLRQSIAGTRAAYATAQMPPPGILQCLLHPAPAGAPPRAFALTALTMLLAAVAALAWSFGLISLYTRSVLLVFSSLAGVSLVGIVYLNNFPAATTLLDKVTILITLPMALIFAAVVLFLGNPAAGSGLSQATLHGQAGAPTAPDGGYQLATLVLLFAIVAPLSIIAISRFFRRTVIQPIERLSRGLQRVDAGDLTAQVPVTYTDEIGSITRSFNSMAASLLTTHQRFERVITSISDHVYAVRAVAGVDGGAIGYRNLFVSPRITQLTGHAASTIQPDWVTWLQGAVHPADRPVVDAHLQALQTQPASEVEYRLICADGAALWVSDRARLASDDQGPAIYGVIGDISLIKAMAATQAELNAMRQLDDLRAELINNVSHELRTPVSVIRMASTTLETHGRQLPEALQAEVLQAIVEQTARLERLTTDLLDISRLQKQPMRLRAQPVNLGALLDQIVTNTRQKLALVQGAERGALDRYFVDNTAAGDDEDDDARRNRCRVVLQVSKYPIVANIDPWRIQQMVENLLENAIKYSPAGGRITVSLARIDSTRCVISVNDHGIGIAPEEQAYIFDTFYRSQHPVVMAKQGIGLGLPICVKIAEAHGGAIKVESTLGTGSTFRVELPCHEAASTTPAPILPEPL